MNATAMIRQDVLFRVSIVSAALALAPCAWAQQRGAGTGAAPNAPVAHENLKILPADIPQAQLLQTMQGFTQALGVQCGYCHASAPASEGGRGAAGGRGRGPAAPQFNFPSDEKPAKKAAREMMTIVRDLNARIPAAVGKSPDVAARVQCVTCHRGAAVPRPLADILAQTAMEKGTPAAVAQYKDLRKQYFGAQAYDFSETTLIAFAQRTTSAEDQVTWLRLNLEYFPFSSRTFTALAQVQQKQNDKDGALKSLTRAVELDPQNAQARRQLDQLKDAK
jgi:photosynthetic reaction center cytochrome c subunit